MRRSVKLYFLTDKKNLVTINISNAEISLKDSDVSKAMDEILESNIYLSEKGSLETKHKAALITKTTTDYNIK